jgi:thioredoxin reductase (NADPH)
MVKNIYPKGTSHKAIEHYDILILGAGPAGLTASLYATRYNLKTAVVAKSLGGTASLAGNIENWPGFFGSGLELMRKFHEQAEKFGARFLEAEVANVKKDDNGFVLEIGDKEIHGKALIICLGTEHKKLDIPGEKEFLGKGVSYCATCDGLFFKNKNVAVIGGADSAAKAALYLSDIAKKVHILYRREQMRCEPVSFEKIKKKENIEIHCFSNPIKIIGNKKVEKVEVEQAELDKKPKRFILDIEGVFIEIGATPVVEIIKNLGIKLDEASQIITDKSAKTNVRGVFAAGDGTNNILKQVVVAAGEGAVAAKSAYDFVREK